jgi:phosphatidylserine/phosphatidylglycerophosphate/cardiolipin synthase-like enzyme
MKHGPPVGSLNGGEASHKLNREMMLLTDTLEVHARLAEVFAWDWSQSR